MSESEKGSCLRGSVWQVRLDPAEGAEQAGTRPVVVISSDVLNRNLPVVTIAALTSRKTDRLFRTEVLVEPPEGGLSKLSKILLYQVRTVSKSRMLNYLGQLTDETMAKVSVALHAALSLE